MTSRQRRSYWRRWHQLLKRHEDKFLPRVQKALTDEAKRVIKEAEDVGFQQAFKSLKLVNEQLLTAVNQMHKQVANEFGMMINRELKKGQKIGFFNANFLLTITEILTRQALELLTLVENTTKERILNILTRSTTEQLTFFETAQQIEREIASPVRALAITRTESNRAANLAALEAAKLQNYVVTKEWISAVDFRTRRFSEKDQYDHALLDGKVIEMYEDFQQLGRTNGIMAVAECPLDPQAPAAFTINCRCVLGFENKRDAQGRLIPKTKNPVNIPAARNNPFIIDKPSIQQPKKPVFEVGENNQKTISNLKNYIQETTGLKISNTELAEIDKEKFNKRAKQAAKLFDEYNLPEIIDKEYGSTLQFRSSATTFGSVTYNFGVNKRQLWNINFGSKTDSTNSRKFIAGSGDLRGKSAVDDDNLEIATVTHEFAHILAITNKKKKTEYNDTMFSDKQKQFFSELRKIYKGYSDEVQEIFRDPSIKYFDRYSVVNDIYLGQYAETNLNEFMAEGFTEYKLKSNPSKYAKLIGQLIDKYYKK